MRREEAVAKAADLAKNLTINFNRKGMHGDLLNSLYLFFNASVQGTMNFGRGLFGPNMNPLSPEASRRKQAMVAGLTLFSGLLADKAEEELSERARQGPRDEVTHPGSSRAVLQALRFGNTKGRASIGSRMAL